MHNGQIGGFEKVRRRLESTLPDTLYDHRQGTTDSELFFLMCVQHGIDADPQEAIETATQRVLDVAAQAGVDPVFKLTAAFADGERLLAVRYASVGTAPSLYTGAFQTGSGRCVVSEPFDQNAPNWQAIPENSFLTVTRAAMTVGPFAPARESLALAG